MTRTTVMQVDGNAADPETGNAVSSSPYKSYVALLSQHIQTLLLGSPLAIGESYKITNKTEGDDFTNVGASANAEGEIFVATGATPSVWAGTQLSYSFAPSAVIMNDADSNFLGEIAWTWYAPGSFTGTLPGKIPLNKTIAFASTSDSATFATIYSNDDSDSLSLNISDRNGDRQDYLSNTAVKIDVYQNVIT